MLGYLMLGEADYRSITSAVRPPRLAVLIDEANPYWRTVVRSLIQIFSGTWGGKYFLMVPTDGKRIKEKFWELLEAYSPDYLGMYTPTLADLEHADPDRYKSIIDSWRTEWHFDADFDEWLEKEKYLTKIEHSFSITPGLDTELKNRLAPIIQATTAVAVRLVHGRAAGFPFTKVSDINANAHRPARDLMLAKPIEDPDIRNLVLSQSGDLDKAALDEYIDVGVVVTTLPENYRTEDMVEALMEGTVDAATIRLRKKLADQLSSDQSANWTPDEDFVSQMPFQALAMLHLARYYAVATHRDWEEPVTVVIGDAVDDYCLYYCLSRLHDGVYWLPKTWVDESERRRTNNRRLYRRGRPFRDYSEKGSVANTIVLSLYKAIGYGQNGKRINFLSTSLSEYELRRVVRTVDRISGFSNISAHADIKPLLTPSTQCVARVIEENNYANQQEMVFIDGRSVGRLATPKPKNFYIVDPARHRWMTSLDISEYSPPPLPYLGGQIALTHQSRMAVDGIVYMCPGIAYFGGDIDVVLTRPQLAIISAQEILRQYFASAGIEVKPSDKGNFLSDTITRFGDVATAASFISNGETRGILDLFLAKNSAKDGSVVYLQAVGHAFVNYDGFKKCVGSRATDLLDDLLGKEIIRRGLVFLCLRCRLASWYDLADITSEFTCHRCGLRQRFTMANWKSPEEPRWYYALAETIYQCYTHNSYLTILVLNYLRRQSQRTFEYLPEIDVLNFPAAGQTHEIDVACLVDNRIFLGECKVQTLKPAHTNKYERLAKMLPRRPEGVVFATTNHDVSDAFQRAVAQIAGGHILTHKDLLS